MLEGMYGELEGEMSRYDHMSLYYTCMKFLKIQI